jgi:ATP/maltotriose-dependent transcriptional regulator MalT
VSMTPGEMALTRIGASSRARERARVSAAALVMATPRVPIAILVAATPEKMTNEPPSFIRGARCLASMSGPITLVSKDLAPLTDPLWLVFDYLHELGSAEVLRQLELLVMRAPEELRLVLATRHDVPLGLHRLRLEGELTEIRADDLRFSFDEARALFQAAGVELARPTLEMLYERTEGWAAGLRLAALSLAGHPDPERLAAEFSGTERTVAEYLLAEVLERQPGEGRRLLLRTSGLDRVNGELADLLTGGTGGERVLQDLEEANAFVVSLDAARSWFRYHHLFAELLQLELRRTQPEEVTTLHKLAAGWLAGHGYPVEAIRHAQAARDWVLAVRLLADHWPGLYLGGQEATVHALMAGFPARALAADAELAAVAAADELARLRWSKSATSRPGQAGSTRPSRTWNRGSRWRAGSGGPISSSWAWCTGRRSSSTGPFSRRRRSAPGRRSSWPSGTAGPTIRTLATPS